jgi:hypothetical protein
MRPTMDAEYPSCFANTGMKGTTGAVPEKQNASKIKLEL